MVVAIIAAAGWGKRLGFNGGKQFIQVAGKPLLLHTLLAFEQALTIDSVIIVTNKQQITLCQDLIEKAGIARVQAIVAGGDKRQDSVRNGLKTCPRDTTICVIHDGARPLIKPDLIDKSVEGLGDYDGVVLGLPAKDTLKQVINSQVKTTLDRSVIWQIQTPQVFPYSVLIKAYEKASEDNFYGTDDAVLVERIGGRIKVILGSEENLKVTTITDLKLAEFLLRERAGNSTKEGSLNRSKVKKKYPTSF
jgi:2-C-methyl-D-erythritol 4-phosphate cytidylyltransferase